MGSQVGNIRLAGDAAARQRAAASEGIQMRRAALQKSNQSINGNQESPMYENPMQRNTDSSARSNF